MSRSRESIRSVTRRPTRSCDPCATSRSSSTSTGPSSTRSTPRPTRRSLRRLTSPGATASGRSSWPSSRRRAGSSPSCSSYWLGRDGRRAESSSTPGTRSPSWRRHRARTRRRCSCSSCSRRCCCGTEGGPRAPASPWAPPFSPSSCRSSWLPCSRVGFGGASRWPGRRRWPCSTSPISLPAASSSAPLALTRTSPSEPVPMPGSRAPGFPKRRLGAFRSLRWRRRSRARGGPCNTASRSGRLGRSCACPRRGR